MDTSFGSDRSATVRGPAAVGGGSGHYSSRYGTLEASQGVPRHVQEQSPYIRERSKRMDTSSGNERPPPRPTETHLNTSQRWNARSQQRRSSRGEFEQPQPQPPVAPQQHWYGQNTGMQDEHRVNSQAVGPDQQASSHTEMRRETTDFQPPKRELAEPEYNDSIYRERYEALRAAYEARIHSLASKLEESLHKVYADEGILTMKRDNSSSQFVQDRIHEIIVEAFYDEKENVVSRLMESNANKESHIATLEQELDEFRTKYHRQSSRYEQEKQHWEITTSESYDRLLESQKQIERKLNTTIEELNETKRQASKHYTDKEYWRQQCSYLESRLQHVRETADNVSSSHKDAFQREYNMQQQIKQLQAQLKREQKNHEVTASKFDEALSTAEELEQRVREKDSKGSELNEVVHERNQLRSENKSLRQRIEEWQNDYRALQRELSDTQSQLKEVEEARDQLQRQNIDISSRVEQIANSETQKQRKYIDRWNDQLHEAQQAKRDLELQVDEQNSKLKRVEADVDKKTKQIHTLETEKADLAAKLEEEKENNRSLENAKEENNSYKERLSQLQERCNDLSQRLSDSQYALSEAKVSHQQELLQVRSELEQEKDGLRSELHEKYDKLLKDTTERLEQQLSEMEASRDDALQKLSSTITTEKHESEVERIRRQEHERITQSYEQTLERERDQARKQISSLKEQISDLKNSDEQLRQQLQEARESAQHYEEESRNLSKELEEAERQLEDTKTQLEDERSQRQQLQEKYEYQGKDLKENEAQASLLTVDELQRKECDLEDLRDRIRQCHDEIEALKQDREEWKNSYEETRHNYESTREENSSLKQRLSDVHEKCSQQEEVIESLREEVSEKSAEARRATSQVEGVQSENSRLEQELNKKQKELEHTQVKLSDYELKFRRGALDSVSWVAGEVARLRTDLDDVRKSAEDELESYSGFCANQIATILRNQPSVQNAAVYWKATQMFNQWREEVSWRNEMQISHAVQKEKEQFSREKESLQEQLEQLKTDNDKLSVSHNFLQQRIMNCIKSANKWLARESQISEDHSDPEYSIELLEGATSSLCRLLESYKERSSQIEADYKQLGDELKNYESSAALYEDRLHNLAQAISSVCSLPRQSIHLLTEASTEEAFNQELEKVSSTLSDKMKSDESATAQLQEQLTQVQSQLESYKSSLTAEKDELNKTREQLFESERYAAKVQVELTETKSNLETANARIEALEKSIETKDKRISEVHEEVKNEYERKVQRLEESLREEREQHEATKQKSSSQSSLNQEEMDKQIEEKVQQRSEHLKSQLEETKRRLDRSNNKTHKLREELMKTARDADETITQERYLREEKERELKSAKSKLMRVITKLREKDEKLSSLKESLHTIKSRLRTYQESSDQLASSNTSQGKTIGSLQAILQRSLDTLSPENINSAQQLSENTERLKSKVYRQSRTGRRTSEHSRRSSASGRRGSQRSDSTNYLKNLGDRDSVAASTSKPLEESRDSNANAGATSGADVHTFTSQLPEEAIRSNHSESFITDSTVPGGYQQESAGSISEGEL